MLFTAVVGVSETDVGATAVALHTEASVGGASVPLAGPAVLASETTCGTPDALKWDAHLTVINGDVISNAGGDMAGSNNTLNGTETYLDTPSCDNQFAPHANPPTPPWGVDFQPVTSPFTYPLDPVSQPFGRVLAANGLCNVAAMAALGITVRLMATDTVPYLSGTQIADGIYCRADNATTPTLIKSLPTHLWAHPRTASTSAVLARTGMA